jgi:uncharacterized protein YegP (UPF0339 family)
VALALLAPARSLHSEGQRGGLAMATATTSAPGTRQHGPSSADADAFWKAAAMRFETFEENSGRHRWELLAPGGRVLATSSDSYASRQDADFAAGQVRRGARASKKER